MMKDMNSRLFKSSCCLLAGCIIIAAYAFIDGSFLRYMGDTELILAGLYYAVLISSLCFIVGSIIIRKLPPVEEVSEEPLWFRRLFFISCSPLPLSLAAGCIISVADNYIMGSPIELLVDICSVAVIIIAILIIIPVLPVGNMIIMLYLYRKNKRKKYTSAAGKNCIVSPE